jgi:hypothetical protein
MDKRKSKRTGNEHEDIVAACCQAWAKWCRTREFYMKPSGLSLLGRLQGQSAPEKGEPVRTGLPPNARNDPFMQYFNGAVHACKDNRKYAEWFKAFDHFYNPQNYPNAQLVKQVCVLLGKPREGCADPESVKPGHPDWEDLPHRTYYNRVKKFGQAAYALAPSIQRAAESAHADLSNSIRARFEPASIH